MLRGPYESDGLLKDTWRDRLQDDLISKFVPAIDHFETIQATWQIWTDTRRPKGGADYTSLAGMTRHETITTP